MNTGETYGLSSNCLGSWRKSLSDTEGVQMNIFRLKPVEEKFLENNTKQFVVFTDLEKAQVG